MEKNVQRLSLLRPVKLRLERPLARPYAILPCRPTPILESLPQGECLVLLRGRRLVQPVPLCASAISRFSGVGKIPLKPAALTTQSVRPSSWPKLPKGRLACWGSQLRISNWRTPPWCLSCWPS